MRLGEIYVVNDVCQLDGCILSTMVYEETNGMAGLQRADGRVDNTCGGGYAVADQRIF